jgi:hypothetical protein
MSCVTLKVEAKPEEKPTAPAIGGLIVLGALALAAAGKKGEGK